MGISGSSQVGLKTGVCTSSTRPSSPYAGQAIYETDTNRYLVWDGTAWSIPDIPAFAVHTYAGSSATATAKIPFNNNTVNVGSCWSTVNHRFTAPIAGVL